MRVLGITYRLVRRKREMRAIWRWARYFLLGFLLLTAASLAGASTVDDPAPVGNAWAIVNEACSVNGFVDLDCRDFAYSLLTSSPDDGDGVLPNCPSGGVTKKSIKTCVSCHLEWFDGQYTEAQQQTSSFLRNRTLMALFILDKCMDDLPSGGGGPGPGIDPGSDECPPGQELLCSEDGTLCQCCCAEGTPIRRRGTLLSISWADQ